MNIVQRATGILMQPRPEWQRIAPEPANVAGLFIGYALILAALPLVAQVLAAMVLAGAGGLVGGLVAGLFGLAFGLGIVFVMGLIANALAPSFGGAKNDIGAMKLIVYAATPLWIAGIVTGLLGVIPIIGALIGLVLQLAAFAYTAYLIYLGSPIVMRVAPDKAMVYALIIAAIWFVIYLVVATIIGVIVASIVGVALVAGGASAFR